MKERLRLLVAPCNFSIFLEIRTFNQDMKPLEATLIAEDIVKTYIPYKSDNYTVFASIFTISEGSHVLETLSSGTKCYKGSKDVVTDCHAEILARRSFIRKCLVQKIKIPSQVGLFCSAIPCGFFSIDPNTQSNPPIHDRIIPTKYGTVCRGKEFSNLTFYPRTKPSKRQAEILLNMSCSDKILKWLNIGFQGKRIPTFIELKYLIINQVVPPFVISYLHSIFPHLELFSTSVNITFNTVPSSLSFWTDFCIAEYIVQGRKQGSKLILDDNNLLILKIQSLLSSTNLDIIAPVFNQKYLEKVIEFKKWRKGWT
eukprot:NODE_23_length_38171_cov_0.318108.p13 type:complete len:313 gc:universal NODE_23_length_38171_cov_0.318108:34437-33499(-)